MVLLMLKSLDFLRTFFSSAHSNYEHQNSIFADSAPITSLDDPCGVRAASTIIPHRPAKFVPLKLPRSMNDCTIEFRWNAAPNREYVTVRSLLSCNGQGASVLVLNMSSNEITLTSHDQLGKIYDLST